MATTRKVRSGFAAAGLAAVAMVATGTGAYAAASDVDTPGWAWTAVEDQGQTVEDVAAFYENYMGSGLDMWGWTDDAFDGFLYPYTEDSSAFHVTYPAYPDQDVLLTSTSATYVDGGVSTIVGVASVDFGDGITFDVSLTLTIQGSYAKWDFTFADTGTGDLAQLGASVYGNLGSDGDTEYTSVDANSWISTDGGPTQNGSDPVLGWHFATAGVWALTVVDGNDDLTVDFAAGPATLVVSLLDWDQCSFDAAVTAMTALAPTLPATFGATNAPQLTTNCLTIGSPVAIPVGSPTNQVLSLTESPVLDAWGYYDSDAASYAAFTPLNLPAGMTLAMEFDMDTGLPSLRLTGTPPAGTTVVTVLFYEDGGGGDFSYPITATFTLSGVLAATGSNAAVIAWTSLGLAAAGLALIGVAWRFRRTAG